MTPKEFAQDPWKDEHTHRDYSESFLHMRPAPEYASGEVVLASVYRNVGYSSAVSEGKVPKFGLEFARRLERGRRHREEGSTGIGVDAWRGIVMGSLRSPKQPNQAAKRFLQICPLVPAAAMYSLSARLSANSWNPGQLVFRMIGFGEADQTAARGAWNDLFYKLSVDADDDIWARFLNKEFESWQPQELANAWQKPATISWPDSIRQWHHRGVEIPACQFLRDLKSVLSLKGCLTRRQWISLVESVLRLGTVSHILWLCRANAACFRTIEAVLGGQRPPDETEMRNRLHTSVASWRYGQLAARTIKDSARDFIIARAGLNLVLWHCEEMLGAHASGFPDGPLADIPSIVKFAGFLASIHSKFPLDAYRQNLNAALEVEPRVAACKGGISSNITEFLRHVLGQRQTSEPGLDSYDQGYYLRKKGSYSSSPWIVSLGPVSVLTLVHCCTFLAKGPRTVEDFCRHLGKYGIEVRAQDVPQSDLGSTLRNLGLVLDSPDAEGGMVLLSPFKGVLAGDAT